MIALFKGILPTWPLVRDDIRSTVARMSVNFRENSPSIYSRTPDEAKHADPVDLIPLLSLSIPEPNALDHQIAMAHGSTMALEMTRSRLQSSKSQGSMPCSELISQKLRQKIQQGHENDFYRECFQAFHQLIAKSLDATQGLALQYHFNPGKGPWKDPRLIRTIILLQASLDKSREEEEKAEQTWKRQWDIRATHQSAPEWL